MPLLSFYAHHTSKPGAALKQPLPARACPTGASVPANAFYGRWRLCRVTAARLRSLAARDGVAGPVRRGAVCPGRRSDVPAVTASQSDKASSWPLARTPAHRRALGRDLARRSAPRASHRSRRGSEDSRPPSAAAVRVRWGLRVQCPKPPGTGLPRRLDSPATESPQPRVAARGNTRAGLPRLPRTKDGSGTPRTLIQLIGGSWRAVAERGGVRAQLRRWQRRKSGGVGGRSLQTTTGALEV